jgi:hypothetical protein
MGVLVVTSGGKDFYVIAESSLCRVFIWGLSTMTLTVSRSGKDFYFSVNVQHIKVILKVK